MTIIFIALLGKKHVCQHCLIMPLNRKQHILVYFIFKVTHIGIFMYVVICCIGVWNKYIYNKRTTEMSFLAYLNLKLKSKITL